MGFCDIVILCMSLLGISRVSPNLWPYFHSAAPASIMYVFSFFSFQNYS